MFFPPRDAATLIILDRSIPKDPKVLMGRRSLKARFMPGVFVFPGGGLEKQDFTLSPSQTVREDVMHKVSARVDCDLHTQAERNPFSNFSTRQRVEGLAIAALRETFEEVGYLFGTSEQNISVNQNWEDFWQKTGPDLSRLCFFAQAITPLGRPQRFDTRFFVWDITSSPPYIFPNLDSRELSEVQWISCAHVERFTIPLVTLKILKKLRYFLETSDIFCADAPFWFYTVYNQKWHVERVSLT